MAAAFFIKWVLTTTMLATVANGVDIAMCNLSARDPSYNSMIIMQAGGSICSGVTGGTCAHTYCFGDPAGCAAGIDPSVITYAAVAGCGTSYYPPSVDAFGYSITRSEKVTYIRPYTKSKGGCCIGSQCSSPSVWRSDTASWIGKEGPWKVDCFSVGSFQLLLFCHESNPDCQAQATTTTMTTTTANGKAHSVSRASGPTETRLPFYLTVSMAALPMFQAYLL